MKSTFPILHPEDLFNKIKGATVFSVFDLENAYFNIPIKKSDRHKTAFILPWNKYEWNVLCYGLVGAPFVFTEAMTKLFSDLSYVAIYFDDILIFSESIDDHKLYVKVVLLIAC